MTKKMYLDQSQAISNLVPHELKISYLLYLADSSLILGQRLSEWCGHSPVLEEDLALSNIALDLIGQARLLLSYAGENEYKGRDEDQLAFLRLEHEYLNFTLTELPNQDFAETMMRIFLFTSYQYQQWLHLQNSTDTQLVAIAKKSIKETSYHIRHSSGWIIRMGDGTDFSNKKTQQALNFLWPYTQEFFSSSVMEIEIMKAGIGTCGSLFQNAWLQSINPILKEAQLDLPKPSPFLSNGKNRIHSEHLGHLLSLMQYMQRTYPGAKW